VSDVQGITGGASATEAMRPGWRWQPETMCLRYAPLGRQEQGERQRPVQTLTAATLRRAPSRPGSSQSRPGSSQGRAHPVVVNRRPAVVRGRRTAEGEMTLRGRQNPPICRPRQQPVATRLVSPGEIAQPHNGTSGCQRNAKVLLADLLSVNLHWLRVWLQQCDAVDGCAAAPAHRLGRGNGLCRHRRGNPDRSGGRAGPVVLTVRADQQGARA
jgi:hypothetical protein